MPCYHEEFPHERSERKKREEAAAVKKAIVPLEALLCSACRELEEREYDFDKNPALSVWWYEHKQHDAAEQREAERKAFEERSISAALAKAVGDLNEDEKALLRKHKYL